MTQSSDGSVRRSRVEVAGPGHVARALCAAAGPWVFLNGLTGSSNPRSEEWRGRAERHPYWGRGHFELEAEDIFATAEELLSEHRSDLDHVLRVDQSYTDWRAVDPYHVVRRAHFGGRIPPSTSVVQQGLLTPGDHTILDVIAVRSDAAGATEQLRPDGINSPPTSGYAPILRWRDLVLTSGHPAVDAHGMAPESKLKSGMIWGGTKVALETEYILRRQLLPSLEASGADLEHITKAQVFLGDMDDIPAFNRVWREFFGAHVPATTIIPTTRFGMDGIRVEINFTGVVTSSTTAATLQRIGAAGHEGHPGAIRMGDLLVTSGIAAAGPDGIADAARRDPRSPFTMSSTEAQMEHILDQLEELCAAAGTTIDNVMRIQQFHTDLNEFYLAARAWERRIGPGVPVSAIEVPAPLPVPGTSILVDAWFYVPETATQPTDGGSADEREDSR